MTRQRLQTPLELSPGGHPTTGALVPLPAAAEGADPARRGDVDHWGRS